MSEFKLKVTIKELPIDIIFENEGQIEGVPRNPRRITDEAFEKLKKSITDSPEMQNLDEIKVFPFGRSFIAISGNHRLRAYKELGWERAKCKILPEDTPTDKLCEYVMKENMQYATNDPIKLEEWNQEQLADWGVEVPNFEDIDIDAFFEDINPDQQQQKAFKITVTCPASLAERKEEIIITIEDALKELKVKVQG